MTKKFIIVGDWVVSKSDGEKHYVHALKLCELYGFNPTECYFLERNDPMFEMNLRSLPALPMFGPKYSGNYR